MNIWIIEFKCHDLLVNNLEYYYVFVYYIDEELSFLDQCSLYYLLVSDCITKSEYVCWCEMYFLSEIRFGNIYCNTNTPCYTYQVDIG